jgi:PAS domain S-box-containing protein
MEGSDILRDKNHTRREVLNRRRTHAAARRALTTMPPPGTRERLESIFRAAPIGIGLISGRVFVEFNDRLCEMTGYGREELLGRPSRMLYATQEDYDYVGTVKYEQIARTGTGTVETRWKRKDGRIIDILLSSSAIDRTDPSKGVTFTATDITTAKEIQVRLHQSEQIQREAEAIAHVGSFRRDLRTETITWSDETYRIYGYVPGEVCPSPDLICNHIHPDDRERFTASVGIPSGAIRTDDITYRVIRRNGQVRTLRTRASVARDASGTPVQLVGAIQDITEQEQVESRLRDSEAQYRMLVEHSPDAICIQCEGKITFANSAALHLLGASRSDEILGRAVLDFVHPDFRTLVADRIATVHDRGVAIPRSEIRYVRLDGGPVDVEVVAVPTTFQGKPAAQFIVRDITERKQVEKNLAESEERFKILADGSFDSIVIHDGRRLLGVNSTFCSKWGYRIEEVIDSEVERYVTPESLSVIRGRMASGYDEPYEVVAIRKDGTKFPAEVVGKPLVYRGQTARISTIRDISSARQAAEALLASEERFRGVFQHAPLGIAIGSVDGRAIAVNPAFIKIVGYEADELVGRKFADYTPPDDYAREEHCIREVTAGRREKTEFEKRFLRKDGTVVWANVTVTAMKDGAGRIASVVGIVEDITERKRAADSLRRNESLLREAQAIAKLGHYVLDVTTGCFETSEVIDRIFGIEGDIRKDVAQWLQAVHPDERQEMDDYFQSVMKGKVRPFDREYRIVRLNDREVRWVHGLGKVEFDQGGKLVRMVGTLQDITERKKTEESLRAQQKNLRSLASELSLAEERERRRIAVELHDHACQSLALAKMSLQSQLEAARPSKRVLRQACHALDETLGGIRNLTFDLSSATLYRFGLEAALEELLADKLSRPKPIPYRFSTDRAPKPLTPETSVLVFQCVRELLVNIVKHARARNVAVEVGREGDFITILVADDGIGFDADAILSSAYRERSVGLFFVRERLDYAGGILQIDSSPNHGARFILTAPLDKRTEGMKENSDDCEDSACR